MYSLKTIINHDVTIEKSTCMYEMKKINGDGDLSQKCKTVPEATRQIINFLKPTPFTEVVTLEARQEKILGQLAQLKHQVFNLSNVLKNNHQPKYTEIAQLPVTQIFTCENLVINTNPSRPCYSILALRKLWKDVNFVISPFAHSSIKSHIPEEFNRTQSADKSSTINLSIIWKDVIDLEVIVDIHGYMIMSEINLLRYLVRIFKNECYEKSPSISNVIQIDRILELSYQLIYRRSLKNEDIILSTLDTILDKNEWFSGKHIPEISDVAIWSAIKQSSITKLSQNLSTWYNRCENFFEN